MALSHSYEKQGVIYGKQKVLYNKIFTLYYVNCYIVGLPRLLIKIAI